MAGDFNPDPNYPRMVGNTGWICPVCGAGVNPGESTCPHPHQRSNLPYVTTTFRVPPCDACKNGGICNCVRNDPSWITTTCKT